MTLPSSPPLSGSQVATELGLSLPLAMNHAWILLLSGKYSLPISFSDLLGKSGNCGGSAQIQQSGNFDFFASFSNIPFFNCSIIEIEESTSGGLVVYSAQGSYAAQNPAKILVKDNTTGQSAVVPQLSGTGNGLIGLQWQLKPGGIGIFGAAGQTHNFTIYPSN